MADDTRAELMARIEVLRAKQDRLPDHWRERRAALGDEIDGLVDEWLSLVDG